MEDEFQYKGVKQDRSSSPSFSLDHGDEKLHNLEIAPSSSLQKRTKHIFKIGQLPLLTL